MSASRDAANGVTSRYILDNFEPTDRLALVLINRRRESVIQRLSSAQNIATRKVQGWLKYQNDQRYEVYISMNTLNPDAVGRTKADVAAIRHVYLDVDENGTAAVQALIKREDLPKPNYLVSSSPGKWQVVWKVEEFCKAQAEQLQRNLVRDVGADPATTDCARVLRLPGFYNHKYAEPYLVRVESHSSAISRPEHFPISALEEHAVANPSDDHPGRVIRRRAHGMISQSERDWSYARRALARGDSPGLVIAAIASYRRYDKHNPQYYAEYTVEKALQSLDAHRAPVRIDEHSRT